MISEKFRVIFVKIRRPRNVWNLHNYFPNENSVE
jgi:hypothetical protein